MTIQKHRRGVPDMNAPTGPPAADRRSRKGLRRRVGLVATLLTLGGIAVVLWDVLAPRPDLMLITKIRPGMTEREVSAVLGARSTERRPWQAARYYRRPDAAGTFRYWYCDAGIVEVRFDGDGRATYSRYDRYDPGEHPTKARVRSLLNRLGLGWIIP
jgi:hypothetical protein